MKLVCDYVSRYGIFQRPDILNVGLFLNHQVDPYLMRQIGIRFANDFAAYNPTKVLTLESSGIAPAMATAFELGIPLVFAKKSRGKKAKIKMDKYAADVVSFTGNSKNTIEVDKRLLDMHDRILIIDDFLATGAATCGMIDITKQAGSDVIGIGAVIRKPYLNGMDKISEFIHVVALCDVELDDEVGFYAYDPDEPNW